MGLFLCRVVSDWDASEGMAVLKLVPTAVPQRNCLVTDAHVAVQGASRTARQPPSMVPPPVKGRV